MRAGEVQTFALGVMARAPSAAGKTRLAPHLSDSRLGALRAALLADALRTVTSRPPSGNGSGARRSIAA